MPDPILRGGTSAFCQGQSRIVKFMRDAPFWAPGGLSGSANRCPINLRKARFSGQTDPVVPRVPRRYFGAARVDRSPVPDGRLL
jgi:hypothetical protein